MMKDPLWLRRVGMGTGYRRRELKTVIKFENTEP
jgi:hypothetical protein